MKNSRNFTFCFRYFFLKIRRMTTVEFGGGPTLEARRRFANLKDGAEIPR